MKMFLKVWVYISIVVLIVLVCSCRSDVVGSNAIVEDIPVIELLIGESKRVQVIDEYVDRVVRVKLDSDVANKIGDFSKFFTSSDNKFILVDEWAGVITCINTDGEIMYSIESGGDPRTNFPVIEICHYDKINKQILVNDGAHIYTYDDDGSFVSKRAKENFNYLYRHTVSKDDVLYTVQNEYQFTSGVHRQVVWEKNGVLNGDFLNELPFMPSGIGIRGFSEFHELDGKLYYHSTLRDTFYDVKLPNFIPAFTVNFIGKESTDNILRNGKIENKLNYLMREAIPFVVDAGVGDDKVFISYRRVGDSYVALYDRKKGEVVFNGQYVRCENFIFQAPLLYDNGVFMRMFSDDEVAVYDVFGDKEELEDDDVVRLHKAREQSADSGDKYIYLVYASGN